MCKWMVTDLRRSICESWVRLKITPAPSEIMDRVGIATRYVLDGPGIESRRGRSFPHPSIPALQPTPPTPPTLQWVSCLFPEVNLPERGMAFTTHHHLVSRLKSTAIPLLPLWVLMACSLPLPVP